MTNKRTSVQQVVAFHKGRGAQEGVFAEIKSQCQMDYVPVRTLVGNQIYLLSAILAHNLTRALQMESNPAQRKRAEGRPYIRPSNNRWRPSATAPRFRLSYGAHKAPVKEILVELRVLS